MTVQDIASYLQERLGRHHPVEGLVGILETNLERFGSADRLWDYIVEHENGLYLYCRDGIDLIL
ncbi:hypothetical protein [Enterocloster citroniae]